MPCYRKLPFILFMVDIPGHLTQRKEVDIRILC